MTDPAWSSLTDALEAEQMERTVPESMPCPRCAGRGSWTNGETCTRCAGRSRVPFCKRCRGWGWHRTSGPFGHPGPDVACEACAGLRLEDSA